MFVTRYRNATAKVPGEHGNIGATIAFACILVRLKTALSNTEVPIRRFTVGFLAFAALAAAGYLLTRRRPTLTAVRNTNRKPVEDLYAAGL